MFTVECRANAIRSFCEESPTSKSEHWYSQLCVRTSYPWVPPARRDKSASGSSRSTVLRRIQRSHCRFTDDRSHRAACAGTDACMPLERFKHPARPVHAAPGTLRYFKHAPASYPSSTTQSGPAENTRSPSARLMRYPPVKSPNDGSTIESGRSQNTGMRGRRLRNPPSAMTG